MILCDACLQKILSISVETRWWRAVVRTIQFGLYYFMRVLDGLFVLQYDICVSMLCLCFDLRASGSRRELLAREVVAASRECSLPISFRNFWRCVMSRVNICLTVVVAALSCMSGGQSFGAGMTCKRIDTFYQDLTYLDASVAARSSSNLMWVSDGDGFNYLGDPTLATYPVSLQASNGGSSAGQVANLTSSNIYPFGTTNIAAPEVSFSVGTAMSTDISASDSNARAQSVLHFGDDECGARGLFQAQGTPGQTGTFSGKMDIIIGFDPVVGNAGVTNGGWRIVCGGSSLQGRLAPGGAGWDVTGTIIVGGVSQGVSATWPLDVNTIIMTSQPAHAGDSFRLEAISDYFEIIAIANPNSAITAGISLAPSFSIQP